MKFQTSMKQVRDQSNHLISVGYCQLQFLLWYEKPIAYSAGVYGWDCDHYLINNTIISTGYRTPKPKNTKVKYETIIKYETEAKKIHDDETLSYNEKKEKTNELLKKFIGEVINYD